MFRKTTAHAHGEDIQAGVILIVLQLCIVVDTADTVKTAANINNAKSSIMASCYI